MQVRELKAQAAPASAVPFVIGRTAHTDDGPTANLGAYRAVDGSEGARLLLDVDGPHAAVIVGKRGSGKSYTLGVLAEELAGTTGVSPVVVDPMGVFHPLARGGGPVSANVVSSPSVAASTLDPRSWCGLLDLDPETPAGSLLWQAAQHSNSLGEMRAYLKSTDADQGAIRAARNHVGLAAEWGVFDPGGLDADALDTGPVTVLDCSRLTRPALNAVVRGVTEALYRGRVQDRLARLPWLLVDEAQTLFDGVAAQALHRVLTRGRAPGVSLVLATQRPSSLPAVALSQSDLLMAHRLTSEEDIDALRGARPSYLPSALEDRLPTRPGDVLIVDDATETVHTASIRQRDTPHGGANPQVSDER